MKPRLAVIDLGTNTFHLLIIEPEGESFRELYRERIFVNLAEESIQRIGDASWERAKNALVHYSTVLREYDSPDIRAIGTAALRRADNARRFVEQMKELTGIPIKVIDGEMEANYISWGVLEAIGTEKRDAMIMDIGGGSVECCITVHGRVAYTASFPIGVAVLYEKYHKEEPISKHSVELITAYLDALLHDLKDALEYHDVHHLVGASGSFEVLDAALQDQLAVSNYAVYDPSEFGKLYDEIIALDLEERLAHPKIPKDRARYIVCATQLIHYALHRLDMKSLGVSKYAMKEGLVREWLDELG